MKTKTVARIGNYSLIHNKFRGPFGEPAENFEVWWVDQDGPKKGTTNSIPVWPPLRVSRSALLFPPLQLYTKKEYMAILKHNIIKFNLK